MSRVLHNVHLESDHFLYNSYRLIGIAYLDLGVTLHVDVCSSLAGPRRSRFKIAKLLLSKL